jgi:hypothetical protein
VTLDADDLGAMIREQIAAAHATLIEKPLLCDALTGTIRALAEKRGLSA